MWNNFCWHPVSISMSSVCKISSLLDLTASWGRRLIDPTSCPPPPISVPTVCQCTDVFSASSNLMRWGEYSLHFTGEETEAPGGQAACPSPLSVMERQSWPWTYHMGHQSPGMFLFANPMCEHFLGAPKHKVIYLSRLWCTSAWRYGMTWWHHYSHALLRSYQLALRSEATVTSLHTLPQFPTQKSWLISKRSSLEWKFWEWFARLSPHLPTLHLPSLYSSPKILKLVFTEDCLSPRMWYREWDGFYITDLDVLLFPLRWHHFF